MEVLDTRRSLLVVPLLLGASVTAGCGDESDVDISTSTTPLVVNDRPSPGDVPSLGRLTVADGCARVDLVDGTTWSESCREPDTGVIAVTAETIDAVEQALLRFAAEVDLVGADPLTVLFEQSEGWALVQTDTPDFTMTFRQVGVDGQAVWAHNPLFIDCDTTSVDQWRADDALPEPAGRAPRRHASCRNAPADSIRYVRSVEFAVRPDR